MSPGERCSSVLQGESEAISGSSIVWVFELRFNARQRFLFSFLLESGKLSSRCRQGGVHWAYCVRDEAGKTAGKRYPLSK